MYQSILFISASGLHKTFFSSQNLALHSVEILRYRFGWAPLSSVASMCDPCAEALQWTRVRLPAQVPMLRVTPPLFPVTLFKLYCQ